MNQRNPKLPAALVLLCFLLLGFSCQKKGAVRLALECKPGAPLHFTLATAVTGTIFFSDTAYKSFSTSAACSITCRASAMDSQLVLVSARGLRIASTILSPQEIRNMVNQCQQTELPFALQEGQLLEKPTESTPIIEIGAWNLFRTFATALPALPGGPALVGNSWDRERHFPIQTNAGEAVGLLFQSFTFDSLVQRPNSLDACLHWQFSYRIEIMGRDSGALLTKMPLQGKGTGNAVIDVSRNKLSGAHVFFGVPKSAADSLKIQWKEEVTINALD
ncbi:MAG: hypothetical protein PHC61_03460 [Chitinivibrionales bacterium]|nr:hypothetical protein [Chitinivibrionales bacterium]